MKSPSSLLASVGAIIDTLTDATILLVEAARYAEQDRFSFNPLAVFAGPLKYWKWHKAKQKVGDAVRQIDGLRSQRAEFGELPVTLVEFSKLDAINDVTDSLPFSVTRVGTKGGPSPLKQQFGVETTVLHQIETTRLSVEHLLSEVGLLHAKLRATA